MGCVAIFPWLKIREKIEVNEFELIPFKFKTTSIQLGDLQEDTDVRGVASNYLDASGNALREIVVLRKKDKASNAIAEEDVNELFVFNELLAFASLGERRFFTYQYWNRDHFQLVIQKFVKGSYSPAVISRRRDGNMTQGFSDGVFKERMPLHVSSDTVDIDIPFLKSLVKIWNEDADYWSGINESVQAYNLANTDSNKMREHLELVVLNGCFERVFGIEKGKMEPLRDSFLESLSFIAQDEELVIDRDISKLTTKSDFKVREAYIKDLFNLRGKLAHGKINHGYPSIWNLREHLIFASYIFPYVVKSILAKNKKYDFTDNDGESVFAFDHLLASKNVFEEKPPGSQVHVWSEIKNQCVFAYIVKTELAKS